MRCVDVFFQYNERVHGLLCAMIALFGGSFSYTSVISLIKYYKEGEDVYQITPDL